MYPVLYDICKSCGSMQILDTSAANTSCVTNQTIGWIYTVFHECVNNLKEETGFILGLVSIGCWVCASIPQLVENFKKKRVEEAISFFFLMFWLLGDASNLTGCMLTGQLPIQIVTAVYYVSMDIVMIMQFLYYRARNRRIALLEANESANAITHDPSTRYIIPCCMLFSIIPIYSLRGRLQSHKFAIADHLRIGRSLLSVNHEHGGPLLPTDPEDLIGYIIGCVSSIFYLSSRIPQILKNYRRKKTDGVSILLFILAVAGNALYGTSVLMQDPDPGQTQTQFILLHLPWLIGSLGTMSLDFTLLTQILYYNRPYKRNSTNERDEEPLIA